MIKMTEFNIDEKKLDQLKELLEDYRDLYDGDFYCIKKVDNEPIMVTPDKLIVRTFKLKKPLSSIEINKDTSFDRVRVFIEGLYDFFYVGYINRAQNPALFWGEIFVSRFKSLIDIVLKFDGLSDKFADLAGILYGVYSLKEIWNYCSDKNLDLIK